MKIIRTNSKHKDFILLVKELDLYLSSVNGEADEFFKQFNTLNSLKHVIVIYKERKAIACGAFKNYNTSTVEIKRMYVKPNSRRGGVASILLKELETWAREIGFSTCVLETAEAMNDAVSFYKKNGYKSIPNYDQYKGVKTSRCFEKKLK